MKVTYLDNEEDEGRQKTVIVIILDFLEEIVYEHPKVFVPFNGGSKVDDFFLQLVIGRLCSFFLDFGLLLPLLGLFLGKESFWKSSFAFRGLNGVRGVLGGLADIFGFHS